MSSALLEWKRLYRHWLMHAALPLWAEQGADREGGGFQEFLGTNGKPIEASRRARVQARQSFTFAMAGNLGWDGPWAEMSLVGIAYLDRVYRRTDGLYATLVADGKIINETATTYDQAFVLLAGAALHAHDPRGGWESHAALLMSQIEDTRRHPHGGFTEADGSFLSNPHMHLLEASLAWVEAKGSSHWNQIAKDIVTLALEHFIDPQLLVLREHFDAAWRPAPGNAGTVVEPGHQFEWAWLLERWARMTDDARAHEAARALFASGTRGVDPARRVVIDSTDIHMRPCHATARLWPQTEWLKASCLLGAPADVNAAAAALWRYLETPTAGLWHDKMREDGTFVEEPSPASSFYHIICAISSLTSYRP